jgi:Iap family predicted aminopeptidase
MERKKVLALKENQVLQKKIIRNHLALQIIRNILEENLQKIHLQTLRKKALVLRERKNLKVEIADLKVLALKNIVKKELNLKIF